MNREELLKKLPNDIQKEVNSCIRPSKELLKELRQEYRLSLSSIAKLFGVTHPTVLYWLKRQSMEKKWWFPYAKPAPTWWNFNWQSYRIALAHVYNHPPSDLLRQEPYRADLGMFICTDASLGYKFRNGHYVALMSVGMTDEKLTKTFARYTGVSIVGIM